MGKVETEIIVKAVDKFSSEFSKITKHTWAFNSSLDQSQKTMKKFGVVAAAATAVVAAGIGFAVKEFAQFEKGMSSVKAITNATGDEFEDLTNLAKEMGATTVFTAKEATEAMKFLGMAGFETDDIMKSLKGTMNLAAASTADLGTSADIMSNILTGFRLEADQADRVVDVLAKTVTSANTDIFQLGEAMKFIAPTAASFGISLEEVSAAVGILGNAGLQGSIATRALSTSMVRITKPTDKMLGVMEDLNLEFFDVNGQFIGLTQTLRLLENRLEGSTDKNKAFVLSTLFGQEAFKQWNVLLATGADGLDEYTKELENSGGTAQKMADTQLDNLAGSLEKLNSAFSGLAIEVGEKFNPIIKGAVDKLTSLIDTIKELGGPLVAIRELIVENDTAFIAISGAVAGLATMLLVSLAPAIGAVMVSFAALALAAAPFIIGGIIIAGIVAGVNWIIQNWEMLKERAVSIFGSILSFFEGIGEAWSNVWNEAAEGISDAFDTMKNAALEKLQPIIDILDKIVSAASKAMNAIGGSTIGKSFKNLGGNLGITPFAEGGIVTGPTIGLLGEAGESEAVIPLSKMGGMGGGVTVIVNGDVSGTELVEKVKRVLVNELMLNSKVPL